MPVSSDSCEEAASTRRSRPRRNLLFAGVGDGRGLLAEAGGGGGLEWKGIGSITQAGGGLEDIGIVSVLTVVFARGAGFGGNRVGSISTLVFVSDIGLDKIGIGLVLTFVFA